MHILYVECTGDVWPVVKTLVPEGSQNSWLMDVYSHNHMVVKSVDPPYIGNKNYLLYTKSILNKTVVDISTSMSSLVPILSFSEQWKGPSAIL